MAARFVVLVALFALCHSNPVLENGENRDGRAYNFARSSASGAGGGANVASVKASNYDTIANAQNDGGAANAPGNAVAEVYKSDEQLNIPRYQHLGYYPAVPAPARLVYQQNIPGASFAKSDAVATPGGSSAQSVASNNQPAAIIAKAEPVKAIYTPAVQPVKTVPAKSISWHFGTAYGTPAYVPKTPEYVAPVYKPIVYEANIAPSALLANSNTVGEGEADSKATQNSLGSEASSHAQSQNSGTSTSGASVGAPAVAPAVAPAYYRNVAGWNGGRLVANSGSSGNGNADANARNNFNSHIVNSAASSGLGGAARSGATSY